MLVLPVTIVLIYVLLYAMFHSGKWALLTSSLKFFNTGKQFASRGTHNSIKQFAVVSTHPFTGASDGE
jgi:hypothetical protein